MTLQPSTDSWLMRLLKWDGIMPTIIWSVPFLIRAVLPKFREPIELVAVVLPIVAFFIRYSVGMRYIRSNHCGKTTRNFQIIILRAGLMILALLDAVLVLTHVMPQGVIVASDIMILVILYVIYLLAMVFALYPGAEPHLKSHF